MEKIRNLLKKEDGITIIEILLALAIIGIVLSMSTGMITQAFRIIIPSSERMSVKQTAEINLTEITSYVRNAQSIDTTTNRIITIKNHEIAKSGDKVIIKDENNNTIRTINNIAKFELSENNDIYTIILEKCIDEGCKNKITVETEILPRN
jgi:type II secretory pathway pseudopilin PulG